MRNFNPPVEVQERGSALVRRIIQIICVRGRVRVLMWGPREYPLLKFPLSDGIVYYTVQVFCARGRTVVLLRGFLRF